MTPAPAASGQRILLGITGSIAAAHAPAMVVALQRICGHEVRCVVTDAATRFVTVTSLAISSGHPVLTDHRDATSPTVDHMDAARWADLVLVMPATADFLGRTATGLAPDVLGTCLLAAECPVVMVPSMNPAMWAKPAVQRNCATLRGDGIGVVPPGLGFSAHDGTLGEGSMPPLPAVLNWIDSWTAERGAPLRLTGGLARVG
jgi:phosphopantothenoylcysteine decarboxylase/phosphopantothenate--cysteine ligase